MFLDQLICGGVGRGPRRKYQILVANRILFLRFWIIIRDSLPLGDSSCVKSVVFAWWQHLITDAHKLSRRALLPSCCCICRCQNDDTKLDQLGRSMLHGKGYDRWFDKSFTIIVCSNGRVGIIIFLFLYPSSKDPGG